MSGTGLFLFGTLQYRPLLGAVLGRDASDLAFQPARLPGYAVSAVRGQAFPMIAQSNGARAEGVFTQALSDDDLARLDYFEAGFGYDRRDVVADVNGSPRDATLYLPRAGQWQPDGPWSLDVWAAQWGDVAVDAAHEIMQHYGRDDADQIEPLRPFFFARAWARQLARDAAPQTLRSANGRDHYEITRERPGFDGFFRLRAFSIRHQRFDGTMTASFDREGFVAYDAALVLPYDPVTDRILLIEQMRHGPILRGDPAPWVLEPIAGLVDAGEAPADTARREAVEEAGLHLGDLIAMTRVYASPGYTTEFFHCYLGLCDLGAHETGEGGLDSEHEDIRSHLLGFDDAMALVDSGEINVGPLTMMLLWLARRRDGLRPSP